MVLRFHRRFQAMERKYHHHRILLCGHIYKRYVLQIRILQTSGKKAILDFLGIMNSKKSFKYLVNSNSNLRRFQCDLCKNAF